VSLGVLRTYCDFGSIPEQEYKVNASAGVEAGQLVYIAVASGLLTACATDGTKCLGWATQDAAVSKQCKVAKARPGVYFEVKFTGTWDPVYLGQAFGITVDGDGNLTLDLTETAAKLLKIEELLSNETTDKRVLVSVFYTANQNLIEVA